MRLPALPVLLAAILTPTPALADHYDGDYRHHHDNDRAVAGAVIGGMLGAIGGYAIAKTR